MVNFRRILFPVDFSERSTGAAPFVERFAERFESTVVLLHAIAPPGEAYGPLEAGWVELRESQMKDYLAEGLTVEVRRRVVIGDPAEMILKAAREEEVDLIMMPTHGYGPFRRFMLGSVASKVLHDAECPVWTAAHIEEPMVRRSLVIRSVVCGIDLDEKAVPALLWADAIADEWGAALISVHAVPSLEGPLDSFVDDEVRRRMMLTAEERISDLMHKAGVETRCILRPGDPENVIRQVALEREADLVVISRASHGLAGRLRTKSYSIIREAPCPVLSV